MATVTMTTVNNILKEVYEKQLRDQLQSETIASKRLEKTSEGVTHEVGGKYVTFPIRTKRNHGIGARAENEALPIAQVQSYEAARVQLKYLYGSLELTGQVFELAEKDFQAFASALDAEVNGLKEGLAKDFNRQVYGTTKGVLATGTGAGTATTFTVATTNPMYVEIGMVVDIYNSADALQTGGPHTVTNVVTTAGTTTITFTPARGGAPAIGDYMVRDNNLNREITGLESIVAATGSLYNIDPSTVPVWSANVTSIAGVLTEGAMTTMVDDIRRRGGRTTLLLTSLGVRKSYANLLIQQRRYTNTTQFEGGFSGLAFTTDTGDIPLVSDFDCQPGIMYFLNEKELKFYEAADWSFMNRDGSNWQRVITSAGTFDAYQATLFRYVELGTHRRNSHGKLTGLTEA